ncbi:MAG: hypothetical protein ACXV5R_13710 [Candidatus Angelobacter sp.]
MNKHNTSEQEVAAPRQNILYVVLHGLVCLIDDNQDQFIADLVDMGSDHEYLCGDFLYENQIPNGATLTLRGVDGPMAKSDENKLDSTLNAVVKIAHVPDQDNYYQSRIFLPRPNKITYYIQGVLAAGSLSDPKNELQQPPPTTISGIRVFEYSFTDSKGVHVTTAAGDMFWNCPAPVTFKDSSTGEVVSVAALHIYNEPPGVLPYAGKHNKDEFNFTVSYLGAQVRLASPAVTQLNNYYPPIGMIPEELHALDMRQEMIQELMKILRPMGSAAGPVSFKLDWTPSRLKADAAGGGGGTQVCGGANASLG